MKRLMAALLAAAMMLGGCTAMGEYSEEAWYGEALRESVMRPGNNLRLKNVIERARQGEVITIGTIGGSITEGANASVYEECWASQFARIFGETYGTEGGANVRLVNSGVGGTSSAFGWMRYGRDILSRVPEDDPDGYPDLVIIEYAVNDWNEPTGGRAYESMVKSILEHPNAPAVMLLFSARRDGWNLQEELRPIGDRYDLPMVSITDGIHAHLDRDFPSDDWYSDDYHPKSVGHRMMADAVMEAVKEAEQAEPSAADTDLTVEPVKGLDFMGLETIYGDSGESGEDPDYTLERGSFNGMDIKAYQNKPVGLVCGRNFYHDLASGKDPLTVKGTFSKCLIAWKASAESSFGEAEVLIDGEVKTVLKAGDGAWGQSEIALVLDEAESAEHTLEIRVNGAKRFTVTAISLR